MRNARIGQSMQRLFSPRLAPSDIYVHLHLYVYTYSIGQCVVVFARKINCVAKVERPNYTTPKQPVHETKQTKRGRILGVPSLENWGGTLHKNLWYIREL